MSDITSQSLSSLVKNIKEKKLSSEEVTTAFVNRSEKSKELILTSQKIFQMRLIRQKSLMKNQTLI